jgi:hypothetical protein
MGMRPYVTMLIVAPHRKGFSCQTQGSEISWVECAVLESYLLKQVL